MLAPSHAYKENKKAPFLAALAHIGIMRHAARAVRISRYAVMDWKKNDPVFASAYSRALELCQRFQASSRPLLVSSLASRRQRAALPPSPSWTQVSAIPGPDGGMVRVCQ